MTGQDNPLASGESQSNAEIDSGELREIGVAEFKVPTVAKPRQAMLRAAVEIGNARTTNAWPLWFFPPEPWKDVTNVALLNPLVRLRDLSGMAKSITSSIDRSTNVVIATMWTDELDRFVSRGGRAILLQLHVAPPGPVPTVEMPFWREAIRLVESRHSAWQDFPIDDGIAGMQFFGCATDCALDTTELKRAQRPILRRLDARTVAIHDYATELDWNDGKLIVSTLRFEGSQGLANSTQPLGIARNTAAAYLLRCWVRHLQST